MPCNSDHMKANSLEIKSSKLLCILEEIKNGKEIKPNAWRGYHSEAYDNKKTQEDCDEMAQEICDILTEKGAEKFSLEVQMWWRDHQKADKARAELKANRKLERERKIDVLKKISPE